MLHTAARRTRGLHLTAILTTFLCLAAEARAELIYSAQAVLQAPPPIGGFTFAQTINQSGLSANYVSGVTDFDTYVGLSPIHTRNNTPPNFAASSSLPPQNIDFDLGSLLTVERLAFWNYPFSVSAGVTRFEVYTSAFADFSTSFFAGAFNPLDDGDTNINRVQVFDLADSEARYVRMRVTATASTNGTGFSEVAFGASEPIPEPSSLALAFAGAAGLAGAVMRRRKRVG